MSDTNQNKTKLSPSEVIDEVDLKRLPVHGIAVNSDAIAVMSQGNVNIKLGNTTVQIHGKLFKQMAEWYLEKQNI